MRSLIAAGGARPSPMPCRTLGEYVAALVHRLGQAEPQRLVRLREVVGPRRARIRLDDDAVDVRFSGTNFIVEPAGSGAVDGVGGTDRLTTIELLAGRIEVTDAILDGRLQAYGDIENLARVFHAIDILLDAATRNPELQQLARDYLGDPCRAGARQFPPPIAEPRVVLDPDQLSAGEREMMQRLDLLP